MNLPDNDVVIIGSTRSIIGSVSGSLRNFKAVEIAHHVLNNLISGIEKSSPGFSKDFIRQFILGICVGSGIGQNLPRQIAKLSQITGLESAFIVNELCGSSLEAVILAFQSIKLGEYPIVIAGGVECMSAAPYLITAKQLIDWQDMRVEEIQTMVVKSDMHDALWCEMYDVHTIVHAEKTTGEWVKERGLDSEDLKYKIDEYAILSNERSCKAINEGVFKQEITIIPETSENDELPSVQKMEKLKKRRGTQYTPEGIFLSNRNSPPPANAAAFLMLMGRKEAARLDLKPMAKITDFGRAGVVPEKFLIAPVAAVKNLLKKTGTTISDYDLMELNTAFGSQMLINKEELSLDMDKVNIYGDCIALGHPIGAAGARLLTTLLYALKRNKKKRGLMSICLGGGNALALAIETEE